MHTKEPKEDPLVDLGYEVRDINTKTIERAVMWFFTFATVMFLVGAWIYANINPAFSPKYQAEKAKLIIPSPPNPLLQTNSTNVTDIMHLRQHETAVLTSTGYTDATRQFVHIPIERAISILATRGLPKTGADVPAISKGNTTDERKDLGIGAIQGQPALQKISQDNTIDNFTSMGTANHIGPTVEPATPSPKKR